MILETATYWNGSMQIIWIVLDRWYKRNCNCRCPPKTNNCHHKWL